MALCFTGDTEKYLKHFRAYNDILCAMPTWVLPAHDKQLENLKRICHHIDLYSSNIGATVAIFRKMLAPVLSEQVVSIKDGRYNIDRDLAGAIVVE